MSVEQDYECLLEQSRFDKIKTLGFLCYNLYIDGNMAFTEMSGAVNDIKKTFSCILVLRQKNIDAKCLQRQETALNEKLIELGCICFNLYVDRKLFDPKVLSLCDSILSINHEIASALKVAQLYEYSSICEEPQFPAQSVKERKNVTQSKLKITCPNGMEPIPANFKRCMCGYRNKPVARFCGKCGAKLS